MDKPGYITPPPGLIPDQPDEQTETVRRTQRKPELPTFVPTAAPGGPAPPPSAAPSDETIRELPENTRPPEQQAGQWNLTMHDGSVIHVTGTMLLGRDPAPVDSWGSAALVRVNDPDKSVSKTHAALEIDDGRLHVTDVHSTNGTVIVTSVEAERMLSPGQKTEVPDGAALMLGRYRIVVSRRG